MLVILNRLAERLRAEVDRIGISDLARKTGSARNTIYNWCEKGNIPLDKLLLLSDFGIDIDYVISGNKKMLEKLSIIRLSAWIMNLVLSQYMMWRCLLAMVHLQMEQIK